jgi:hypothetical protein
MAIDADTRKKRIEQYRKEKKAAMDARQVRIASWTQNEQLYNGYPTLSLVTRSNLHVPKVFESVQTMSSKIGPLPEVEFKTKPEGDDNAPEIMKALWDEDVQESGGEFLWQNSKVEGGVYGRPVYKMIPRNDGARIELVDTMAFLINPTAKSVRDALYCGQQFIYKTIDQIEDDAKEFEYNDEVIKSLKEKKQDNETPNDNSMEKSLKDLRAVYLGYANVTKLGKDMVELTEWYTIIDKKKYVMTVANDTYLLRCVEIKEVGLPRWPFFSWAVFPRGVAFWTPGIADVVRDPNLAMDVTMNQMIDNNTYRNFGMVFVSSQSGLKQSSLIPRPLGVTPVNVPTGSKMEDHIMPWNPPEIDDAANTLQILTQIAERSVGLSGTPVGSKGKQSVTQQAEQNALIESKTNLVKQNAVEAWEEGAQLYAEIITMHLTKPRRVKVYGYKPVTIETVTRKNFRSKSANPADDKDDTKAKYIEFIATAQSADTSNDNKAIKQKAMVELFTLFKDDPGVPGQKFLRERVAKEFALDPTEIDKLFTQEQALPGAPTAPPGPPGAPVAPPGGAPGAMKPPAGGIPTSPATPLLSATGSAAAAQVAPAIR